jgi:hypothetical protein
LAEEGAGAADPDALAAALEGGGVDIVGDDVFQLGAGEVGLFAGEVEFGELDLGAGIGMAGDDLEPDLEGAVGFAEGGEGFGEGHEGVAVVVPGILGGDAFEEGAGFGGAFLAEEALAEMGAGVEVLGIAFEGGAVAGLGLGEPALLKIDVGELGMVVGFVQMIDLGLEFFDAFAVVGAGEFEPAGGGGGGAVDV